MGALEVGLAVQVQQAEERMGALERWAGAMVQQVNLRIDAQEKQVQSGAIDELNEDVQRLYVQSFGALVEERKSPDGGWYTKQEFNRFFSDDGLTWSECSGAKRGRPVR